MDSDEAFEPDISEFEEILTAYGVETPEEPVGPDEHDRELLGIELT